MWPGDLVVIADEQLILCHELDLVTPMNGVLLDSPSNPLVTALVSGLIPAAFTVQESLLIPWRQVKDVEHGFSC